MSAPVSQEPAGWQAQKSAATRNLIVDATIHCLIERGYRRTTTQAIAAQAGLSRGALLHHFPRKSDAIGATVAELYRRRLQAFERALARRAPHGPERTRALAQAAWEQAQDPAFAASFELAVAARTDRALASVLAPAAEGYAREWRRAARAALAPAAGAALDAALELTRAAFEGLALTAPTGEPAAPVPLLHALELVLGQALRSAAPG